MQLWGSNRTAQRVMQLFFKFAFHWHDADGGLLDVVASLHKHTVSMMQGGDRQLIGMLLGGVVCG